MRLSSTDIYAFKALAHLGMLEPGAWGHGDDVAHATGVPGPYLARILAALTARGITASRKGAAGGYALARDPREITLSEVVRAIDGPVAPLSCSSLNWHKPCPEEPRCTARGRVWTRVRDAVLAVLETTSVADLVEDARQGVDYTHCLDHLLRPHEVAARPIR